jgi:hypothetical protein
LIKPWQALFFSVLAVWAALHHGVLSYIFLHPASLSLAVFAQMLKALARLACIIWLLAASAGLGRLLLKALALPYADPAERCLLEAGLGLGLISHCLFFFGLLSLWKPAPLLVLFCMLSLLAWLALRPLCEHVSIPGQLTWPQALFAAPIILAALYGLVCANAPPTEWDALAVHLELPKLYAQLGSLLPLRWLSHGFDPMAVEMLYVPALVFKALELPAMTALLLQGLMAAALWVFASRLSSRLVALAAVALFLAQPAVIYVSGTPGTDFGVGLFGMLAFWSAWRGVESKQGRWLMLSGAFSGLAEVSKTTGFFLAAALALILAWQALVRQRSLWRWAPGWAGTAALFAAPWLLRNLICTHNPIWPYLPRLFGGTPRDIYIFSRLKSATLEGAGSAWPQLLLLPFNLILKPAETFHHSSRELLIPFLALGALSWRRVRQDSFAKWVLAYLCVFTLLWFHAVQNWRYFIPIMPWLCLLACAWAAELWGQGGWRRPAAWVLAVGFLAMPALSANNALFPVLGLRSQDPALTSQEAYLGHSLDSYPAMAYLNRATPAEANILLYREVRPFYLDRHVLVGDPQNEMLIRYEELDTPEALYLRLRALGIDAVLFDPHLQTFSPAVPGFARAEAMMIAVLRLYAEPPVEINGVRIYSWRTR